MQTRPADPSEAARSAEPDTAASETQRPRRFPHRWQGSRIPARVRILGWLVLTMAIGLATVGITLRTVLVADVDNRADADVSQEIEEFNTFAEVGVDPASGEHITTVQDLLAVHLARQYPGGNELLIGWSPQRVYYAPDHPRYDVVGDPYVLEQVLRDGESGFGTVRTPLGESKFAVQYFVGRDGERGAFAVVNFTARVRDEVDERMITMVWISLAALVLTAGVGWVVSGRILAPVRLVRRAAADLSAQDLSRRIPVRGRDDIAALAEQFNAMLDRLDQAFATQRQFVDDASHELRTPITIVRGHLELMGDDPVERAETIRLVTDELDRMGRIVEDLLVLAKAERPDFVRPEPVEAAELTSDIDLKVRALADRRWILADVDDSTVWVDPQRVTQAMAQLAQNAVQHTGPDDTIRIGSAVHDGPSENPHAPPGRTVLFWVSDTGPGITPQEVEVIFERFTRGAAAPVDEPAAARGAGLGLAIVKAIADAHHGRVTVSSTPGSGATFALELPADAAPPGWGVR